MFEIQIHSQPLRSAILDELQLGGNIILHGYSTYIQTFPPFIHKNSLRSFSFSTNTVSYWPINRHNVWSWFLALIKCIGLGTSSVRFTMSYVLSRLSSKKELDRAIKETEDKVLVLRFGKDNDLVCMQLDEIVSRRYINALRRSVYFCGTFQ